MNAYRVVEFFGIPISRELVDSDVTGAGGSVKMTCISEVIMEVDAVGSGYTAKTQRFDAWFGDNQQGVIYMVSDGSAPTYVNVKIYTVTSAMYKVQGVKITGGVSPVLSGSEFYAQVLCSPGARILSVDGGLATVKRQLYWEPISFAPFNAQVQASEGAVYTVIVDQGVVQTGAPSFNAGSGGAWDCAWQSTIPGVPNWALAAVLLFLVLRR